MLKSNNLGGNKMKKQKGFTRLQVVGTLVALLLFLPWPLNIYKFSNCDFKSDYKCEAIHGTGIFFPPLSYITVWFGTDE